MTDSEPTASTDPAVVISLDGYAHATVEADAAPQNISITLVPEGPGDTVLVHADEAGAVLTP